MFVDDCPHGQGSHLRWYWKPNLVCMAITSKNHCGTHIYWFTSPWMLGQNYNPNIVVGSFPTVTLRICRYSLPLQSSFSICHLTDGMFYEPPQLSPVMTIGYQQMWTPTCRGTCHPRDWAVLTCLGRPGDNETWCKQWSFFTFHKQNAGLVVGSCFFFLKNHIFSAQIFNNPICLMLRYWLPPAPRGEMHFASRVACPGAGNGTFFSLFFSFWCSLIEQLFWQKVLQLF